MKCLNCSPLAATRSTVLGLLLSASAIVAGPALAQGKSSNFYEDALRRYEGKDYPGAVIQLKNALKGEPQKLAAHLLLGKALMQTGDVVGAEATFKEAIRLGINRSEVVVPFGQALLAQGKHNDMLSHPALQPTNLSPSAQQSLLLLRASAQTDQGDTKEALASIQQARQIDPKQPEAWLAEVAPRLLARQFPEALQAVQRALELSPNMAQAHYIKGSVLHVQGDLRGAQAAYNTALQVNPQDVEALISRVGLLLDLNRLTEASQDLAALSQVTPREPRASYLKALVAERQGQAKETQAALREVTNLLDPVPPAFIRYKPQLLMLNGLSHYGLNEYEKARLYLEIFIKSQPNSPVVRLLARIYLNEGNTSQAVGLLESYLKTHPNDGQALNLLGSGYMAMGKPAKATQLLQQAVKAQDNPEFRTSLGISLIGSGQTDGAIKELENAYRKNPKQFSAGVALVQLYLMKQRTKDAVTIGQSLVKNNPQNGGLYLILGNALLQSGQTTGAREAYQKAATLSPDLPLPQLQLARLDINERKLPAAEQRLSALLKKHKDYADAMAEMARIADLNNQPEAALNWLIKARDNAPRKDLRWNLALIDLYLRTGRPELALQEAKNATSKKTDDLTLLLMHSRAQLALGDLAGAKSTLTSATRHAEYSADMQTEIAALMLAANHPTGAAYSLDKALAAQPDYLPAQALMAQVELLQGTPSKAEARAKQLIQAHPKRAVGHTVTGDIAMTQGRGAAAIAAYRQAAQVEPSSQTTLKLMQALTSQNQAKEAQEVAQQRLKQQPSDGATQKALANLLARSGRYEEAAKGYKTTLLLEPGDADTWNNLANVQLRLKDAAALQTAEKARTLAPGNPLIIDTVGWVLVSQGQVERALPLLRDARLREPNNPEIRYHLATALSQSNRPAEAREELIQAFKISGQFEGAKDAEQLLIRLK